MIKSTLKLGLLALVLIWATGCSQNPADPDQNSQALSNFFGGYEAVAEAPAFGDAQMASDDASEIEFDDPILLSPGVDSLVSHPEVGLYHLRVVWGRLEFDSTVASATDWSGSITVSSGGVVVRRLIRFEEGQDYLLDRTDRKLLEWVSVTTVHNDGLAMDIFVPLADSIRDSGGVTVAPFTLTFETGPYSRTFSSEELMRLDTIVYLDDSNAVAFHAFRMDHSPCPRGFLAGRWGFDEEGEGVFMGRWMDRGGRIVGHLKGHFGRDEMDQKIFVGKWISADGNFEGFVRGRWEMHPDFHADERAFEWAGGWFAGGIFTADRVQIGVLGGRFVVSSDPRGGFFQGRWRVRCPGSDSGMEGRRDGMMGG